LLYLNTGTAIVADAATLAAYLFKHGPSDWSDINLRVLPALSLSDTASAHFTTVVHETSTHLRTLTKGGGTAGAPRRPPSRITPKLDIVSILRG
jgi:hypothetical protein